MNHRMVMYSLGSVLGVLAALLLLPAGVLVLPLFDERDPPCGIIHVSGPLLSSWLERGDVKVPSLI